jgi:hypothetical protein
MYLHLGGEMVVLSEDVVVILEYKKEEMKSKLDGLLKEQEKKGHLVWISQSSIKSIVMTKDKVFASPVSSHTLQRKIINSDIHVVMKKNRGDYQWL